MDLFDKQKVGLMDVIRCDEHDYLIWKWHPAGTEPGKGKRENSIRWGASLRVREGSVAVFVYSQPNGVIQDYIEGPCDVRLDTLNLPIFASIRGLLYGGDTPFQAEVYFINLAKIVQVKFGVPYFDVYDPRFVDFGVPVAIRGTISFCIKDYQEFIKLHSLTNFSLKDFQTQIRGVISRYVKDTIANAPAKHNIPLVQIKTKTAQITDEIEYDVSERLKENFGVAVSGLDIGAIELDKTSDGYAQLMSVTKNLVGATAKAEAEVKITDIVAKQRIEAENYEETLRIQREEAQYAQRKATETTHMEAYQIEKQTEVGIAGAEALGKIGASGAGGVDFDGGGAGFNPATIMVEMAMGGAVGQNMAGIMSSMMGGLSQSTQSTVMPPIPNIIYYVAKDGQPTGPYNLSVLSQMIVSGALTIETLVWKEGMTSWENVYNVDELRKLFPESMPPIPSDSE